VKRIFALSILLLSTLSFSENTIIAIVNNDVISLKSIESKILNTTSKERKIEVIYEQIEYILQLKKAEELNLVASSEDVSFAMLEIASLNNVSIEQLRSYPEFLSLEIEVIEKISINNLQKFITKNITISGDNALDICPKKINDNDIKQIKIAQIIISEVDLQGDTNKDMIIKLFLNKLSKHINKGASFEAFAMLHSQHPSYKNGGKTNWIPVDSPTMMMLNSLKDNEISKVYLTNFGFAIGIKIDERLVSSTLKKCEEKLIYLKAEEFYLAWVEGLREDAYIKIYHDNLK